MTRTHDLLKSALAYAAFLVALGLVGGCLWELFELITGYTENIFRLAGY